MLAERLMSIPRPRLGTKVASQEALLTEVDLHNAVGSLNARLAVFGSGLRTPVVDIDNFPAVIEKSLYDAATELAAALSSLHRKVHKSQNPPE